MDELRWDERPGDLRSPVMIAAFGGWNDAAAAASNAVVFVGERLGARRVAAIDPESFYDFQATRPLVDLTSEATSSRIVWPEVEILAARVPDGRRDVVLVAGRPGRVMLLLEAAGRAGVAVQPSLLGRPTCMALPAALAGGTTASTACIGNRVYTDLGEDELYVVIPGRDLARVAEAVETIVAANDTLAEYHRGRRQSLATG